MSTNRLQKLCVLLVAAAFFEYWLLLVYCDLARPAPLGLRLSSNDGVVRLRRGSGGQVRVEAVAPDSPAARAGIRGGDQIDRADARQIRGRLDWMATETNLAFGRPLELTLIRGGAPLRTSITPAPSTWREWRDEHGPDLLAVRGLLLISLIVAFVVAWRRPADTTALLGAAFLGTMTVFSVTLPYRFASLWRALPWPLSLPLWLPFMSSVAIASWGYSFFAVFPRQRFRARWPWLLVWLPMVHGFTGQAVFGRSILFDAGSGLDQTTVGSGFSRIVFWPDSLLFFGVGYLAAALVRLILNYRRLTDRNEQRRVRVVMLGSLVGALGGAPVVVSYWQGRADGFTQPLLGSPAAAFGVMLFLALPISFAYAILRHRLFDLGTIVRQGVRYMLLRGGLFGIVPLLMTLLAFDLLLHGEQSIAEILSRRLWIYAGLTMLALLIRLTRQHWLDFLDRRFFREQYNAQRLLRQIAEDLRLAERLEEAAATLLDRIRLALHPSFAGLYVRMPGGRLRCLGAAPAGSAPLLANGLEDIASADSRVDLIVPIRSEKEPGYIVLGAKRSEEPYSSDDRELLGAIAESVALAGSAAPATSVDQFEECLICAACFTAGTDHCVADGSRLVAVGAPRALLERYRLERRLGRGGMGVVYVARDAVLNRRVAIKLVSEERLELPAAAAEFQREARAMAAFSHPHVVTVHDFGIAGAHAFIVMELLEGRTLRDALRADERFDCQRALNVLRDVAAAVGAAHARHLVHQDLKPENIWLTTDGTRERAKVLDFGLATFLAGADLEPGAHALDGTVVGTPLYMAPEQLRGEEPDAAWDLWALAVVAFEMVCGSHPFALTSLTRSRPQGDAADDVRFAGLPSRLPQYFARALSIGRAARPQTSTMLIDEFERSVRA